MFLDLPLRIIKVKTKIPATYTYQNLPWCQVLFQALSTTSITTFWNEKTVVESKVVCSRSRGWRVAVSKTEGLAYTISFLLVFLWDLSDLFQALHLVPWSWEMLKVSSSLMLTSWLSLTILCRTPAFQALGSQGFFCAKSFVEFHKIM